MAHAPGWIELYDVLDRDGERVQRLNPDLTTDVPIVDVAEILHGP